MKHKKDKNPLVSVLLSVYNAGKYLQESVESILRQTYTMFELLVLDDGSTDGCADFLNHIIDERVHLIKRVSIIILPHSIMVSPLPVVGI